jgi:hypothetical protein
MRAVPVEMVAGSLSPRSPGTEPFPREGTPGGACAALVVLRFGSGTRFPLRAAVVWGTMTAGGVDRFGWGGGRRGLCGLGWCSPAGIGWMICSAVVARYTVQFPGQHAGRYEKIGNCPS